MNETLQNPLQNTSKRWSVAASASSIVSAILASACCLGPLVLALLGLGGAGALVALKPYQPYFVALTVLLLGTGFYLTYRKPRPALATEGSPECACPAPTTRRAGAITLWIATILVVSFLVFPMLAPYIFD